MTPREKQQDFFEAVGRAVTQWQNVEAELYHIFQALVGSEERSAVSAAFFSVTSFKGKLDMVNAAALFRLERTHREAWAKLYNKALKKSRSRNELAHFMAIGHGDGGYVLRPNIFNAGAYLNADYRRGEINLPQYDAKQLMEKATSFGRLSQQLHGFSNFLSVYLARPQPLPDKSPE